MNFRAVSTLVAITLGLTVAIRAQAPPDFTVYFNERGPDTRTYHVIGCPRLSVLLRPVLYSRIKGATNVAMCQVCKEAVYALISGNTEAVAIAAARTDFEAAKALDDAKRREDEKLKSDRMVANLKAETARMAGPLPPLTEATVRQFAAASVAGAKEDSEIFKASYAKAIRRVSPEYEGIVVAHSSSELIISVQGPAFKFGFVVSERLRRFLASPTMVAWDPAYTVSVTPLQIDAPSIERVVLQRNGAAIAPLSSTLKPSVKVTKMNAKAVINEGEINFPASAFAPGATGFVKLIAIPTVGENITHTFTNQQLHSIR